MHANAGKHTGCTGESCTICPKLDRPGWEAVRANLGMPATSKPRVSISELAKRRKDCQKAKAAGLPCPDDPASIPAPVARPRLTRPRLLFASHDLSRTGAPILLANLAARLRGYDVVLFSPHDGPIGERYIAAGIPRQQTLDLAGFDLVVANSLPSAPVVGAAKAAGIPCVWLIHESDPAMCGNLPDVQATIDYPTLVFPCRATADAYAPLRPQGRSTIIPTVIPPVPIRTREPDPDGPFVLVTFGTDEPRKGHEDLHAAITDMHGVKLIVVNDVPDPWTWLQLAHCYVCTSRIEAFPLSLQEAKAYGLPVITTPVYGCAEIIRDGIDGLHYQPGDVAGLRAAIERLRADPTLCRGPLTHLPSYDATLALYDEAFRAALSLPPAEQPLHVVYHVAGMGGHWKAIVSEQLGQLAAAGLVRVLATHVGDGPEWLLDEAARHGIDLTLCQHEPDLKNYEVPAIRLIERLTRNDDRPILYLHSKGVSHPLSERHWHEWRRLMMRELVMRWRDHLPALNTHDAVGVNWWTSSGNNHFSGNFFLSSAAWLRRLPKFDRIYRDRYSPEVWIGLTPGCKAKSLVCSDKRFWDRDKSYLMSLSQKERNA